MVSNSTSQGLHIPALTSPHSWECGYVLRTHSVLGDLGVSSPRNFDYFFQPSANRRPSTAQSDKYRLMRFW